MKECLKELNIFQVRTEAPLKGDSQPERFKVGQKIKSHSKAEIEQYCCLAEGNSLFTIGAFSSVASTFPEDTIIGRFCSIAPGVRVMGFRHPIEAVCQNSAAFNFRREYMRAYLKDNNGENIKVPVRPKGPSKSLKIGHDVWIGGNTVLKADITIGNSAVIAGNSVVTKDVPPYSIIGGNPAKFIKYRFKPDVIAALEAIEWWNYEYIDILRKGMDLKNPESFIKDISNEITSLRIANYKKFSSLRGGLGVASRGVFLTHFNTILRLTHGELGHDSNILDNSGALNILENLSQSKLVQNDNGSVSIYYKGNYLSAKPDGSVSGVAKNDRWEQFQ